jgi:repressor LexA
MVGSGKSTTRDRVLEFIRSFMADKGYSPSVGDIVAGCGLSSPNLAQYHLNVLEREGMVRRTPPVFRRHTECTLDAIESYPCSASRRGALKPCRQYRQRCAHRMVVELSRELVGGGRSRPTSGARTSLIEAIE